jgi:hypothetical protein
MAGPAAESPDAPSAPGSDCDGPAVCDPRFPAAGSEGSRPEARRTGGWSDGASRLAVAESSLSVAADVWP